MTSRCLIYLEALADLRLENSERNPPYRGLAYNDTAMNMSIKSRKEFQPVHSRYATQGYYFFVSSRTVMFILSDLPEENSKTLVAWRATHGWHATLPEFSNFLRVDRTKWTWLSWNIRAKINNNPPPIIACHGWGHRCCCSSKGIWRW
jgi:hypothetical protein